MFGLFKTNPRKKLEKAYAAKLEEARNAQRSGDLRLFAKINAEAEAIAQQMDQLPKN